MSGNDPVRIVVGVDDSLAGLHALRRGVAEARRHGASLHAVRVWRSAAGQWGGELPSQWPQQDRLAEATGKVYDAFAAAMGGLPRDITVEIVALTPGPAGCALVDYADSDRDLLIVGAARRGLRRLAVPWSTTRYCVAHARCAVLVVPPPALARTGRVASIARAVCREAEQLADTAPSG